MRLSKNPALVGEQVLIKYTINEKATDFIAPDFKGLRILSGPNPSTQSSYSLLMVKAQVQPQQLNIFKLNCAGDYNISPASITVDGEQIKANHTH